eukprot:Anaeramoba_ignava/a11582_6.p1 GENE.a11582_6~~a11582_6.p1  ORF type:complete len:100 (-),score=20.98 a11582_6:51-350(-)
MSSSQNAKKLQKSQKKEITVRTKTKKKAIYSIVLGKKSPKIETIKIIIIGNLICFHILFLPVIQSKINTKYPEVTPSIILSNSGIAIIQTTAGIVSIKS